MPDDDADLRRLGRSLGFTTDPVAELTTEWKQHALEVRRLHEKLFYRPLLAAVARIPGEEARLTPEAAKQRLDRARVRRSRARRCARSRRCPAG